jgi:hypothetical protein
MWPWVAQTDPQSRRQRRRSPRPRQIRFRGRRDARLRHARAKRESNIAKCVVCLQIMDTGKSTEALVYKLIQRPNDA